MHTTKLYLDSGLLHSSYVQTATLLFCHFIWVYFSATRSFTTTLGVIKFRAHLQTYKRDSFELLEVTSTAAVCIESICTLF